MNTLCRNGLHPADDVYTYSNGRSECRPCKLAREKRRDKERWRTGKKKKSPWALLPQATRDRLRRLVFERDNYTCQIKGHRCTGAAEDLDHIVPLARKGPVADISNLRAACVPCNRGRGIGPDPEHPKPGYVPPSREW